jgi:hypothetical protein
LGSTKTGTIGLQIRGSYLPQSAQVCMLLAAHEINAFGNSGGELVGNTPHLVIPESVQEAARQELGPLFAAIGPSLYAASGP